jgi:hypothetical protein
MRGHHSFFFNVACRRCHGLARVKVDLSGRGGRFRVQGLGFRVQGLEFGVQGLGRSDEEEVVTNHS